MVKIVSESSDTITVVTGEQIPKVRFSSIPRMLIIDFQEAVNLQALTELQASQAEFRGALADFIQYTLDIDFCIKLRQTFLDHRDSIMHHEAPKWHARYTSMCCWFLAIYDMFYEYCTAKIFFSPTSVIFHQTFVTTSPSKASVILKTTASSYFSRHLNHYVSKTSYIQ